MQLLYVWIEEYKNIKEQGFNFSSEFTFTYKDGVLTIEDNPNYIEGFFGENISNVTAIIGKNGSGKSNLLNFIIDHISNGLSETMILIYKNTNGENLIFSKNIIEQNNKSPKSKFTSLIYQNSKTKVSETQIALSPFQINDWKIKFIFYSNSFDGQHNGKYGLRNINGMLTDISTEQLMDNFTKKANGMREYYNFELQKKIKFIEYFKKSIEHRIDKNKNLFSFIPDKLVFANKLNFLNVGGNLQLWTNFFDKGFIGKIEKNKIKQLVDEMGRESFLKIQNLKINEVQKTKYLFILNLFIQFLFEINYVSEIDDEVHKKAYSEYNTIKKLDIIIIIEKILVFYKKEIVQNKMKIDNLNKLISDIKSEKILKITANEIVFNITNKNQRNIYAFLNTYYSIYELSYFFMFSFEFRGLSSGEYSLLTFFSRFYLNSNSQKLYIILIDEIDLYFHPEWQRKFIDIILLYFKFMFPIDRTIQLILTSHSPFVISDLPKENVIFLDRDNEGNCIVSDMEKHKQTFGANIHTLLSDGFFMEGGLMGEFAKGKIQEVIDKLKECENNTESLLFYKEQKYQIKQIIDMIGEPLIKEHLLQRYNRLFLSEKESLEQQLKFIQDKLKKYDSNQ